MPNAATSTAPGTDLLKVVYPKGTQEPLYGRSKFFADAKKKTDFGGLGQQLNITIGPTGGGSATFGDALDSQEPTSEAKFLVTHKREYQLFSLEGEFIARSRGDKNAILEGLKHQVQMAMYAFTRIMSIRMYGQRGGRLGVISSTSNVATASITLASRADIIHFETAMRVQLSSDDGNGTSPAGLRAPTSLKLISKAQSTGGLTAEAAWNTIVGAAVGDSIFRRGDYTKAMTGAGGWVPSADPTPGENFFGRDRSVGDVQRQSGIRVSGQGKSKEETLNNAAAEAALAGALSKGNNLRLYTSPLDMRDLINEVGTKRVVDMQARNAPVGFRGVALDTAAGLVEAVSDPDCPQGSCWLGDPDDVVVATAGECPMVLDEDGAGKILRAAADDAYQGRLGCYGNIWFENPGHWVNITW
jgi:hypothetical protein